MTAAIAVSNSAAQIGLDSTEPITGALHTASANWLNESPTSNDMFIFAQKDYPTAHPAQSRSSSPGDIRLASRALPRARRAGAPGGAISADTGNAYGAGGADGADGAGGAAG
jgi:hypothetical protein